MRNRILIILILFALLEACSNQNQNKETGDDRLKLLREQAFTYYNDNQYNIAAQYLDTLIELDTLNADYFFKRGHARSQLERYDESSKDFLVAINLKFKVSKSYYNIGVNNVKQKNDSLAMIFLKESIKADSMNVNAQDLLKTLERLTIP